LRNIADQFRAKLSENLRTAMLNRDGEGVKTLRSIMTSIDNAGAISAEMVAKLTASSISEASRKELTKQDIIGILDFEIQTRSQAASEYDQIGKVDSGNRLRHSIEVINQLKVFL
jgi:uncharacterized protein YqeY